VFVEFEPQSRIEGDLQQMPADFAVTELWSVLAGHAPGRRDAGEITVFDSVGFALEDFSALRYLREQAVGLGLGADAALIPVMPDPKDLFAQLATEPASDTVSDTVSESAIESAPSSLSPSPSALIHPAL
jgi:ornithine cyclodeaminase